MLIELYLFLLSIQIRSVYVIFSALRKRSQWKTTITPFILSMILSLFFHLPLLLVHLRYFAKKLDERSDFLHDIRALFCVTVFYLAAIGLILGLYISPITN